MSTTESEPLRPPVNPRPGVVRTLGICNILFSLLTGLCLMMSTFWFIAMMSQQTTNVSVPINGPRRPGTGPVISLNPFMGMDDPKFIRFSMVDAGTSAILNGLMFATGIGLINLKRWGARWWTYVAWAKIVRLVLLWGFYIVVVAPSLSENMARNVSQMFEQQGMARGRAPSVGDLTRIYSIMNLITAVSVIVFGTIYPAISLWVISRPGPQAALVDKPESEPKHP